MAHVLSKEFRDIQTTMEFGITLKHERAMIQSYSKMHRRDK